MVEFVSYDGKYPNYCMGTLVLRVNGKIAKFDMISGGCCWFDKNHEKHVEVDEWIVNVPSKYEHLRDEIENCANSNVAFGCCGGCI